MTTPTANSFVFACADELVDDDLRAVGEISKLGFPQNERFRIVAGETVFKSEAAAFGEAKSYEFRKTPDRTKDARAAEIPLPSAYHKNGVSLVKSTALRILPSQSGRDFPQANRAKCHRFGKTVVDGTLALSHFERFQELHNFRMNVKSFWRMDELLL